jgi:hypothetical protein
MKIVAEYSLKGRALYAQIELNKALRICLKGEGGRG